MRELILFFYKFRFILIQFISVGNKVVVVTIYTILFEVKEFCVLCRNSYSIFADFFSVRIWSVDVTLLKLPIEFIKSYPTSLAVCFLIAIFVYFTDTCLNFSNFLRSTCLTFLCLNRLFVEILYIKDDQISCSYQYIIYNFISHHNYFVSYVVVYSVFQ